jgi:hypothetical protein
MAWGEWMIPELSISASVDLEHKKRLLLAEVKKRPDEVAQAAAAILQHNAMLQSILRKATTHIAELELKSLLSQDDTSSFAELFE